ncbi:ABC transporter ATP-binding protein [Desulfobulbus oligotrophicus]|uniref:ABC transporter ATP-binding protein n=1 Tax=Desulfobulbus oligotrophicus TaxID=1909699 RepID=A0A7T5VEL5_9BACT|nr:ABC transporter ATP-binding protein [Desulfobulbus oligotrophicus]QQG66479.1 ABC transporter ATP-binding protein [Desulfobulbus oligotrophicus]
MSSEIAIKVENLSKCYQIYNTPRDRLKQFILPRIQHVVGKQPQQYYREFWALKDISFEVKKGETVGIIGRNGSGKSTLLQLICGTLYPTSGLVQTHGRIAALLELGSGFNPEFSGRENVYMSCALLGLKKDEIDRRFDDIAAFADIGDFIEQPAKSYSSGMFVRLAFAVNVISSPDIMVVDEALAVGDMNFQAKCMTALTRFQENGGTVLFVSHDVGAVKSLCKQAVYLEHGKVVSTGPAPEVAERYVRTMREEISQEVRKFVRVSSGFSQDQAHEPSSSVVNEKDQPGTDNLIDTRMAEHSFKRSEEFDRRAAAMRYGSGGVHITYVELLDLEGNPLQLVSFNQEVRIVIYVESECEKEISVNFNILDDKKINLVAGNFLLAERDFLIVKSGSRYRIEYSLCLPIQDGIYSLCALISTPIKRGVSVDYLDVVSDAVIFNVDRWDVAKIWSKVFIPVNLRIGHFPDNRP